MTDIAVVYHSGFGHTAKVAHAVHEGVTQVPGVTSHLMHVDAIDWKLLGRCEAMIFGAPTYMGSASAPFKAFMDQTSRQWFQQSWKDKIAAGFANAGGMSGDKLNVLIQLAVFAAQHGMIWVGQAEMNMGNGPDDINRMGSNLGLMSQSDNDSPDVTPPEGDLQTARLFGKRVAEATCRWVQGRIAD